MIAISAAEYDATGSLVLTRIDGSDFGEVSRRSQRTATIDGGCAVVHRGQTDADRTLRLRINGPTTDQVDLLDRVLRSYDELVVSCRVGCFLVVAEAGSLNANRVQLTLPVIERLDI